MKSRAVIAVAAGLGVGLASFAGGELDRLSAESWNKRVEACASQLGTFATQAATVPEACLSFSDGNTFPYHEDAYQLPSSRAFLHDNLRTPLDSTEAQAEIRDRALIIGGMMVPFAFIAAPYAASISRPRRSRQRPHQ